MSAPDTAAPRGARAMNLLRWALIVGLVGLAAWALRGPSPAGDAQGEPGAAAGPTAHWRCPMHPQIDQTVPGTCPICKMDLVRVETATAPASAAPGGVPGLAPVRFADGTPLPQPVRLVAAARRSLADTLDVAARLEVDEARIAMIHSRYSGFLESLTIGRTGERVRAGQVIGRLYSPELVAAQTDYLAALASAQSLGQPALAAAARARTSLLSLSEAELARLERTREVSRTVDIIATASGTVIRRDAVVGQAIDPSTTLLTLGDLTRLFATLELPEAALARARVGETVSVTLDAWPDAPARPARLVDVLPEVDVRTRTVRARAVLNNDDPQRPLLPGMLGRATLSRAAREAVVIPAEAVVDRGRGRYVFKAGEDGHLMPTAVRTGARDGSDLEIVEGLAAGDRVATGAVFLIDAAATLGAPP